MSSTAPWQPTAPEQTPGSEEQSRPGQPSERAVSTTSATIVECDDRQLVVLLDNGTRRRLGDPAALGMTSARRGQRVELRLVDGRVTAAGLAVVPLGVRPERRR